MPEGHDGTELESDRTAGTNGRGGTGRRDGSGRASRTHWASGTDRRGRSSGSAWSLWRCRPANRVPDNSGPNRWFWRLRAGVARRCQHRLSERLCGQRWGVRAGQRWRCRRGSRPVGADAKLPRWDPEVGCSVHPARTARYGGCGWNVDSPGICRLLAGASVSYGRNARAKCVAKAEPRRPGVS
jgi:hypothetical protein